MAKREKSRNPIDCTMSLGDHLEELRARLILAVLGLLIGTVVSLIFGTKILKFIEAPYTWEMNRRLAQTEKPRVKSEVEAFVELFFTNLTQRLASDPAAPEIDPKLVAFVENVSKETAIAWVEKTQGAGGPLPREWWLTALGPADAFMAYMKVSLVAGLILTSPWVFYQLWMFVAAGLYESERKYVHTAIPFSTGLFVTGALFFLFVIARVTLRFFLSFGDIVSVTSNWTLPKYISFVTILMLVFGVAFQTPIAVFILVRTGLVSIATLRRHRKYVILGLAFLAAVATPSPDPFSMLALLLPLYGLYELGIMLSVFAEKKAREGQAPTSTTSDNERSVKRRRISVFLVAVLAIGVVWVALTFLYPGPPSMPSYAFLTGRNPAERQRVDTRTWPSARMWQDTYSFAGDFNDVCAGAGTELSRLGFTDLGLRGQTPRTREYERGTSNGAPLVTVRIHEDSEFIRDANVPQASRQTELESVVVDIVVTDLELRLWKDLRSGPVELLRRVGLLGGHREPTTPASK